jgi:hypothetical protein
MGLVRLAVSLATVLFTVGCASATPDTSFYCTPYLGLVTASALAELPDATAAGARLCPAGTACVAETPPGVVCGEQPDGGTTGDACPSFMCASVEGGDASR